MDRYSDDYGMVCKDEKGDLVLFDEAQAEIDSRDKRIAELEAQLAEAKADADALRLAVDLEMTLELNATSSGAATRRGSWFYVAAAEAGSVLAATRCAIRHAAEAAA